MIQVCTTIIKKYSQSVTAKDLDLVHQIDPLILYKNLVLLKEETTVNPYALHDVFMQNIMICDVKDLWVKLI